MSRVVHLFARAKRPLSGRVRGKRGISACAVAAATLLGAAQAHAGVVLSEDFSGVAPLLGYSGAIAGSVFTVTSANVDVIGGGLFNCVNNAGGKCLDLVGENNAGAIQSTPLNLLAGATYTVSFGAVAQGYNIGDPASTTFAVELGDLSQSLTIQAGVVNLESLTFVQAAAQANAALTFTNLIAADPVHGAVLDHIVVTETPAAGVPEPAAWAMMIVGLFGAGAALRRRRKSSALA